MSEAQYTLHFVGWKKEGTSDKVWGYFSLPSNEKVFYTFWGRRGAKLTFKRYEGNYKRVGGSWYSSEAENLAFSKKRDGYVECPITHIEAHTPGFTNEFELQFVMNRMMNKFHGVTA